MNLATRCPACGTVFRVVRDQLKVSEGWVRCGRCSEVFNAGERLFELEPALRELERSRLVAEKAAFAFSEREVDARARSEMTRRGASAIRVLEPATPRVEGVSLKLPAIILTLILAGLAALAAGLVRAMTRSGFATPGSVERTLGLPVLAAIQKY